MRAGLAFALGVAVLAAGCANAQDVPSDKLDSAYLHFLDTRRCALLDPAQNVSFLFAELDRTDAILLKAGAKGLTGKLLEAAIEWRQFDETADKACYFQMKGGSLDPASVLRNANDALQKAIDEQ